MAVEAVMNFVERGKNGGKHKAAEGELVESGESGWKAFVVASKATATSHPAETGPGVHPQTAHPSGLRDPRIERQQAQPAGRPGTLLATAKRIHTQERGDGQSAPRA
jgi:hypothetical protein